MEKLLNLFDFALYGFLIGTGVGVLLAMLLIASV
jgi:hypothetical protein